MGLLWQSPKKFEFHNLVYHACERKNVTHLQKEWGFNKVSRELVCFLNSDFKSFRKKVTFERARLGFKIHFLSNSFHSFLSRSLRKLLLKKWNVTKGVGQKVYVLFEWPLTPKTEEKNIWIQTYQISNVRWWPSAKTKNVNVNFLLPK